jgi:hypothetical protein
MIAKKTVTTHFGITKRQSINFVDVTLEEDLEAFVCPFLVENNKSEQIVQNVHTRLVAFFTKLNRDYIVPNDRKNGLAFLSHLHEPNEYRLGYSDSNKGKAVGNPKAESIFDSLRNNRFAKAGGITITNEAHNILLLVKGIGQDIMSDVIVNVCRDIFADFTHHECTRLGIVLNKSKIDFYDDKTARWVQKDAMLPFYLRDLILLPKIVVSIKRSYSNSYNWFIARNYIAAEIINGKMPVSSFKKFVNTLKTGEQKAIVKEIYKQYKKPKDSLTDFVIQYNGSLEEFAAYAKEHYPELNLDD